MFPRKEENLYKYFPEWFSILKDAILNIPGIRFTTNRYINDAIKLIKVSLIRWIWVLTYIPQKHVI